MLPNPTFLNNHVAVVELLWIFFGALGFSYAFRNVKECLADHSALVELHRNGYLLAISLARRDTEICRMLVQSVILLIGIYAVTQQGPDKLSFVGAAVTLGFLAINILTGLQSWRIMRLTKTLDYMDAGKYL